MAGRLLVLSLGLLGLILLATGWGLRPPAPEGPGVPPDGFSAGRAAGVLRELYGGISSHPVGSPENRVLRDRIVAHLREMGYRPEIQRKVSCRPVRSSCAVVENILARLDGQGARPAVMLSTHYDSVAAGPGASDAGVSVAAVLEIARILEAGGPGGTPVIFLIGDGEEAGLLGARAFVEHHRWATEVGAVINLEARGTSGRSWMFETSPGGAWLVRAYARSVPRPATASVAYAIYRRMPTDTDLTVYKSRGLHGLGLAFIGHVQQYHTSLDDLEHLSLSSLQHQGASALALARELRGMDLTDPRPGEAVFFDLAGRVTLLWPAALAPWMAGAGLLLGLAACRILVARRRAPLRELLAGAGAWLGAGVAGGAAGWSLLMVLDAAGAFPKSQPAHAWAHQGAAWGAGALAALLLYGAVSRWAGVWGLLGGSVAGWGLLGAGLTAADPALSYTAVIPALAAGAACLAAAVRGRSPLPAFPLLVLPMAGGPAMAQLALVIFGAMGRPVLPALSILAALTISTALPALAAAGPGWRRGLPAAALAVTAAFSLLAWSLPSRTQERPRRLSLAHHQEAGSGSARWAFYARRPLPDGLLEAAGGDVLMDRALPWWGWEEELVPAPAHGLEGPRAGLLEGEAAGRDGPLELHLSSPRGASLLDVVLPGESRLTRVRYPGVGSSELGEGSPHSGGTWRSWRFRSVPPEGVIVRLDPGPGDTVRMWVMDRSRGLPAAGRDLLAARPDDAVPFQTGDVTVVYRKVRIPRVTGRSGAPSPPPASPAE